MSDNAKKDTTKKYADDITVESFNKCVEELIKEGKTPSVRSIRDKIGGSNDTITRMLREYNKAQALAAFNQGMPLSFQEATQQASLSLYNTFSRLWLQDRVKLQNEYDVRHKELSELIAESDAKVKDLDKRLNAEIEAHKTTKDELASKEKQLKQQIEVNNGLAAQIAKYSQEQQQRIIDAINALKPIPAK